MPWTDVIDPNDDLLHEHDGHPYWNESTLLSFTVPERNICGFIYYYFRPNMNLIVAGPAIWDLSGEEIYNCLYWGWDQHMTIPDGAQMYDFKLNNSLEVRTVELQKEYRFSYDAGGFALDLTWTALMEPHYMRGGSDGEVNDGIKDWVKGAADHVSMGHYEQSGWMRGTVTVDGEVIEVDCGSLRDHGWGPRLADGVQFENRFRGGWPYAIASADSSFHLYSVSKLPLEDDPIEGTVEPVTTGYYVRDGIKAQLVSGTRRCERGPDGRPVREIIEATDELGRTLHARGEIKNWLRFILNTDWIDFWCLVEWEYDGQIVHGETHDFMLFRHWRRYWETLNHRRQLAPA